MPSLVDTLAPYIPPTLLRTLVDAPRIPTGASAERFPAAVLFADVSGFTPLTEALAAKGPEGTEELTRLLNHYLGRMIALLEAEGGQVLKFIGDALIVLFPAADEPLSHATRRARQAADTMQGAMAEFSALKTSVGPVTLEMKISIGAGEIVAMQVGGVRDHWEYIVGDDPLRQVAEAESRAGRGEIILSPEATANLYPGPLPPRPLALPDWSTLSDPAALENTLRCYVPPMILRWLEEGLHDWLASLRPMSILFARVDGLDYAQAEALERLHSFLRTAQQAIHTYEGVLSRVAVDDKGTVLLVLFGAPPYAHEDDPERAVRCALDLVDGTVPPLQLSVGITTGRVFAGPMGGETRRQYALMGDTVNLSARLMGKAEPGKILCDADTYRQARGRVAFENLPPIRVKGKAGLIQVYQPSRQPAVSSRQMAAVRWERPIVGREAELARLETALDAAIAGSGRVLVIEGEAGIGKSRLILELHGMLQQRGLRWLFGAGQSIEQQTPYRAWRTVFSAYFGLSEGAGPHERQERVSSLLREVMPDQIHRMPLLNDVLNLGLPDTELTASLDPGMRQQSLTDLLLRLLRKWAQQHPLILVIENAQWLDSLSWELLTYGARALGASAHPFMLVVAARPPDEQSAGADGLAALRTLVTVESLRLARLSPDETVTLAAARLGLPRSGLPGSLAELVRERAGGNPFFAEELVLTLRDQGVIRIETTADSEGGLLRQLVARCVIQGDLDQATRTLPGTVQGLILSRIDRLPPERQMVLKVAAVLGHTVVYSPLHYVLGQHTSISDASLQTDLEYLAAFDLVPTDVPDPEPTYTFQHLITQEAAYQTLLYSQRRQLHRTAAQWYEGQIKTAEAGKDHGAAAPPQLLASGSPHLPLLVYHCHHAQDWAKERHYARLAGDHAASQFANAEAVRYFTRALELLSLGDPPKDAVPQRDERYALLLARERVYNLQGQREAQYQDLVTLEALAAAMGDDRRQAEVALRQGNYAEVTGDYPAAVRATERAIQLARSAQDGANEAAGHLQLGLSYWRQGEYEAATPALWQALALARTSNLRDVEATSLRNLGIVSLDLGHYEQAQQHLTAALAISREIGDRLGESACLNNLGTVSFEQGRHSMAKASYMQALELCREVGDRRGESIALNNLGTVSLEDGDLAGAHAYFGDTLVLCQEINEPVGQSLTLNNLGMISLSWGDYDTARSYFDQALQMFRQIGDRRDEGIVLSNLALLCHSEGDNDGAEAWAEQALQIAREVGDRPTEGEVLTYLGHALTGLGKLEGARTAYQQAVEIRNELADPTLAAGPLAGLAFVAQAHGELAKALRQVEMVLASLQADRLESTPEAFRVYLTCYEILQAAGDPRSRPLLQTAHRLLQERAGRIDDAAMRRSFLKQVTHHRRIVEAFRRDRSPHRGGGTAPGPPRPRKID